MIKETIAYLEDLLSHPEKILVVIKGELTKLGYTFKERTDGPNEIATDITWPK